MNKQMPPSKKQSKKNAKTTANFKKRSKNERPDRWHLLAKMQEK